MTKPALSFKDAPDDIKEAAAGIVRDFGFDHAILTGAIVAALVGERESAAPSGATHPSMRDIEIAIGAEVRRRNRIGEDGEKGAIASSCEGAAAELVLNALASCGFEVRQAASGATQGGEPDWYAKFDKHGQCVGLHKTRAEAATDGGVWEGDDIHPLYAAPVASATLPDEADLLETTHSEVKALLGATLPEVKGLLTDIIRDVQEWVDAVQEDSSWDGWDIHYKYFSYGGLDGYRARLDALAIPASPDTGWEPVSDEAIDKLLDELGIELLGPNHAIWKRQQVRIFLEASSHLPTTGAGE